MDSEYVGKTYRLIAGGLRFRREGHRFSVQRPLDERNKEYTDLTEPTLVTFEAGDEFVDPAALIRGRAIAEYKPAQRYRAERAAPAEGEG